MGDTVPDAHVVEGSAQTVPMTEVSGERKSLRPARPTRPEPRPDSTQGRRAVEERMRALVAREERAKFRKRLRGTLAIGTPIWLAFGIVDIAWYLAGTRPGWLLVVARAIPALYAISIELHLRREREPSIRLLRFYETSVMTLAVVCLGVTFTVEGGWQCHSIPVVVLILMGHGMFLGSHWRRSIVPVAAMTLAVPGTLLVASAFLPALAAQLTSGRAMFEFAVFFSPVLGAAAISLGAGHSVWTLRNELAEAKSIGRYRLRRRIAHGGMGEIWAAYHAGLRRDVAVKLIQPRLGEDQVAIERFEREVRALAELTHPNTIRVFDYGATETGVWYYAMELLEAQDLSTLVAVEGPIAVDRAVRLVRQGAEALGEAHGHGIVHRDVKPANFLLVRPPSGGEFVKLIDFGIAKTGEDLTLTRTGMVVGTPGYIAPEVITGGEATPRSDVYALGMVLYLLLVGDIPYDGTTPMAMVQQALEKEPPPLRTVRADVPERIEAIVARCCARDPMARFADAGAVAEALRQSSAP